MKLVPHPVARLLAPLGAATLATLSLTPFVTSQRLVLWNTLDNPAAVAQSLVGSDLVLNATYAAFVPAVHETGLTLLPGPYDPAMRVPNVKVPQLNKVLTVQRGTVEIWLRLDQLPVAGVRDSYQLFGAPGTDDRNFFRLWVADDGGQARIFWTLDPRRPARSTVRSLADGMVGYAIADQLGRWLKIDVLWDMNVIGDTDHVMQMYVDNQLVAVGGDRRWGDGFGDFAEIGGGVGDVGNAFVLDELKVWNAARRPTYDPVFFPIGDGCAGSAGVPKLAAAPGEMPWMGAAFTMRVSDLPLQRACVAWGLLGFNRVEAAGYPLPLDLGVIGMTGCTLYVSAEFDQLLGNHIGFVDWTVFVPSNATLLGASFYTQAVIADAPANPFGMTVSNASEARIGTEQH